MATAGLLLSTYLPYVQGGFVRIRASVNIHRRPWPMAEPADAAVVREMLANVFFCSFRIITRKASNNPDLLAEHVFGLCVI